ncbi:IS607 family transposase [Longirhabdus pacifica]|uniref:IS607 family transposase n=1 Tax=Longirhabdus pacifica TaxID=2305227 RepID=UPI001008E787|nr:IS607 family transposase [Longirhabdus pacifica]
MNDYYNIGQFAKLSGKSISTLRLWDKQGKLKPHHISEGGHRYYSQEQLDQIFQRHTSKTKKVIGYCRVLNKGSEEQLHQQISDVTSYMVAKGYQFEIITDIGSGLHNDYNGQMELIDLVIAGKVEKIVVLHKERLLPMGFDWLQYVFSKCGTEIEVIDNTKHFIEQDIEHDIKHVITQLSDELKNKKIKKAVSLT